MAGAIWGLLREPSGQAFFTRDPSLPWFWLLEREAQGGLWAKSWCSQGRLGIWWPPAGGSLASEPSLWNF